MVLVNRSSNSSNSAITRPTRTIGMRPEFKATKYEATSPSAYSSRSRNDFYDPESDSSGREKKKFHSPAEANFFLFIIMSILCYFCYNNQKILKASMNEMSALSEEFRQMRGLIEDTEDELDAAKYDFNRVTKSIHSNGDEDEHDHDDYYFDYDLSEDERKNAAKDLIDKHDKQAEDILSLQQYIKSSQLQQLEKK